MKRTVFPPAVPIKPLIRERVRRDPEFRKTLIQGAIECMLEGDVETGNLILREYVNEAIGFEKLAKATKIPSKSMMRMLSAKGNPQSKNLFGLLAHLQKMSKFKLEVRIKD
jgi:DNA-binding phage protein